MCVGEYQTKAFCCQLFCRVSQVHPSGSLEAEKCLRSDIRYYIHKNIYLYANVSSILAFVLNDFSRDLGSQRNTTNMALDCGGQLVALI